MRAYIKTEMGVCLIAHSSMLFNLGVGRNVEMWKQAKHFMCSLAIKK